MKNRPTDNLTGYLKDAASRIGNAQDEVQAEELLRCVAAEIRECINAERLEAASRLAAWLAHQINNPLGTISGNAQLLSRRLERDMSDQDLMQKCLGYVDAIQSQTERCARITGDLLDFTRPRDVRPQKADVPEMIAEAVELARYGRTRASVVVSPGALGGIPKVETDREAVVRALYEVLVNAIVASPEGGDVTVDAAVTESGDVRITVTDAGDGIASDVLPRIFDPFFSTGEKSKGLGLTTGLAMVRTVGGSIDVIETWPGRTVVAVELPGRRP